MLRELALLAGCMFLRIEEHQRQCQQQQQQQQNQQVAAPVDAKANAQKEAELLLGDLDRRFLLL